MINFSMLFLVFTAASVLGAPATNQYPTLEEVKKTFYDEEVVPDVLSSFNPKALLWMTYTGNLSDGSSSKVVLPGTNFVRNDTLSRPEFSVQGLESGPYFIAMVDPDAPSRTNHSRANIRHLLAPNFTVTNVESEYVKDSYVMKNFTEAYNDYRTPTPPPGSGRHRYVALVYAQPDGFDMSFLNRTEYAFFNLTSFVERTKLGEPLAGTFLTVDGPPAT